MMAKLWRGFHDIGTRKSKMAGKLWCGCHGIGTNQAPSDDWQTDGFPKHKLVLPSTVENLSQLAMALLSSSFVLHSQLRLRAHRTCDQKHVSETVYPISADDAKDAIFPQRNSICK
jgi:hypothetical protein